MRLYLLLMAAFLPSWLGAAELAYPQTEVGTCEVKTLPAGRILVARSTQGYFSGDNRLFGKLFRYIQRNRIPMTSPVEARMEPGTMIFYVDTASAKRTDLTGTPEVELQAVAERQVASVGIRGSYTALSYTTELKRLQAWVATQRDLEVIGEPYAVYWDSPFVPGFMKRSEVHLPVRRVGAK